jgi:hypothetical protein
MDLRRKLFGVWCGFTVIWLLLAVFGGDGSRILLKFKQGGWRGAYVHVVLTILIAVVIPLTTLLVGRGVLWIAGRFSVKSNQATRS